MTKPGPKKIAKILRHMFRREWAVCYQTVVQTKLCFGEATIHNVDAVACGRACEEVCQDCDLETLPDRRESLVVTKCLYIFFASIAVLLSLRQVSRELLGRLISVHRTQGSVPTARPVLRSQGWPPHACAAAVP